MTADCRREADAVRRAGWRRSGLRRGDGQGGAQRDPQAAEVRG